MAFHRLTVPSYLGGLISGFDYINDPVANGYPTKSPAFADGMKSDPLSPNQGTYFDAFGEDATSSNANRGNKALAENCDYLDNVVNTPTPVLDSTQFTLVAPQNYYALTGDIFVGKSGTSNNQAERDKLVCLVTDADGNEVIDTTGVRSLVSQIDDGGGVPVSVVGTQASGFYTNPTVRFNVSLPAGVYRLHYGRKSRLSDITNTLVDIGAILANDVLTAHRVPAESMRFMAETSRRTAGSVDALACAILETPGAGDNIKPESLFLTIDLDPNDDASDSRYITVRAGRDGTPYTLFEVVETVPGDDAVLLRTRLSDLGLQDERMRPTSGNGPMNLTDATNYKHRLWGKNWTQQPALMSTINNRWTVTCGDGTNTFGDFNGVTAVADALTFARTNNIQNYHLFVKAGSYDLNAQRVDSATAMDQDIIIEGDSASYVEFRNSNDATSSIPALTAESTSTTRIAFRNINFTMKMGAVGKIAFRLTDRGFVKFEDCTFVNQSLLFYYKREATNNNPFGDNAILMKRCRMVLSQTFGSPALQFYIQTDFAAHTYVRDRFLFEDCFFQCADDNPLVYMLRGVVGYNAYLKGFTFNRCRINLASTATSGGNMTGNCGLFYHALGSGTTYYVWMEDLEFLDCDVTANYLGTGANSIFLFLRTYDGLRSFLLDRLTIKGGTWSRGDTELSPFFVGPTPLAAGGPGKVTIEDLEFEQPAPGKSNGAPHTVNSFAGGTAEWAEVVIACTELYLDRIKWIGEAALSDSGQLYAYRVRKLNINDVTSGFFAMGSGGSPAHRFKIQMGDFGQEQQGVISNVRVPINNVTVGADAATVGVFVIEPWLNANQGTLRFQNVQVSTAPYVTGAAFTLRPSATYENGKVSFEKCFVHNIGGHGFDYSCANTDAPLKELFFEHCYFNECDRGINIDVPSGGTSYLFDVTLNHNRFKDCADVGVYINPGSMTDVVAGGVFTGNTFDNNNGAESAIQIQLASGAAWVGTFYGNTASKDGSGVGVLRQVGSCSTNFRGTETGYTYDPTLGTVQSIGYLATSVPGLANYRYHSSGVQMIHNRMNWQSV